MTDILVTELKQCFELIPYILIITICLSFIGSWFFGR